jgi:PhnB protein
MKVEPYLFFEGRCAEALEFYRTALGADILTVLRYRDSPVPPDANMIPPEALDKVMHASFRVGETVVMCSDGHCSGQTKFGGMALSITLPDAQGAERLFAALADGGQVQMPLTQTFFASHFGMVSDRFGLMWMILAGPQEVG